MDQDAEGQDDGLVLAGLLCARLCHDLSGPVSAVGTGAELLAEEQDPAGLGDEAMALLISSAAAAAARLRFLRVAFGSAGGNQQVAQLRKMTKDFLASLTGREQLVFEWPDAGTPTRDGEEARLLTNLVLLGRDCLLKGGRLTVGPGFRVAVEGQDASAGEAVRAMAATRASDLSARGAQGYLTALLARKAGLRLVVTPGPNQVTIAAIPL